MLNIKQLSMSAGVATAMTLGTLLLSAIEPTNAATLVVGSIDLRNGTTTGNFSNNFVSFVESPTAGHDGYYETVLKITLDPNYLFTKAIFDVKYDAEPTGMTVNIGDSITNNGYSGDGGTQSNDAEMQIGNLIGGIPSERNDMRVFGNDYIFPNDPTLIQLSDIVTSNTISTASPVSLVVSNQSLAWNNSNGLSGVISSPYLYALAGQADGEGSINYDFFASFNRSISSPNRWGTGVSEVKISLYSESVPEPTTLLDFCLAVGVGGFLIKRKSQKQNKA